MTIIRTHDPARVPSHWTEIIAPGQYAVFLFDVRTHVARDADGAFFNQGHSPTIALCDNYLEATTWAHQVVASQPDLCCQIFDHHGKANDPLDVIYHPDVRGKYKGLKFHRRETLIGGLITAVGVVFIIIDFNHDLLWIWGYVIGVKLVLIGGAFLVRGITGWYETRAEA